VPVSPATTTVREAFKPDDQTPPVADGEGGGQVAGDEPGGRSRTRRIALVGACVLAFALGFTGMTALTRGSDSASSPRPKPTQPVPAAGAPAAPASSTVKAPTSAPTPPSSALVGAVGNDQAPAPQSSQPPMPRTGNAGPPAPSTTTTVPSTTSPTTTPSTTTP
jgi:hypothetical protein